MLFRVSSRVSVRVMVKFSAWFVTDYAHVFVLIFVVIVTLPVICPCVYGGCMELCVGVNASRIVLTVQTSSPDIHQQQCLGDVYQVRASILAICHIIRHSETEQ